MGGRKREKEEESLKKAREFDDFKDGELCRCLCTKVAGRFWFIELSPCREQARLGNKL